MKFLFVIGIVVLLIFMIDIRSKQDFSKMIVNGKEINLEVVKTLEDKRRGLSGRDSLDADAGMLFLFEDSANRSFWMKEMNFPIDILWIDENREIVGIEENVFPNSFPQKFLSPKPVPFVVEVNGGWSREHKIKVGDTVEFDWR